MADVRVENHGTIFLFRLDTEAAREWVAEHVSDHDATYFGGALVVEHRFAPNLAAGMMVDLEVDLGPKWSALEAE